MRQAKEPNEIPVNTNWGAICLGIGIVILFLSAACVAVPWFGLNALSDADKTNDFEAMKTSVAFSGLVIPLAAIGAVLTILGLVLRKPNLGKGKKDDAISCPGCGRKNALTTKVCPRCETRVA